MSWLSAIGSIFSWVSGESIAASLVRTAIGLGVMSYLNKSTSKGASSPSSVTPQGVRQQIPPSTENKIPVVYGSAYLGGTIIDVRLENNNKELYAVLAICEETGDIFSTNVSTPSSRTASNITVDEIYINSSKITFRSDGTTVDFVTDETGVIDRNPSGLLGIYLYKGSSNDPMLPCLPNTTNPIPGTVPPAAYEIMPGWTEAHRADNIIFAVVKLNYDPSKGLNTIPNLKFRVNNTLNKPGDVLHDYATNEIYGAGLSESDIDSAGIVALNTYSDQVVTYGTYAPQPRYRINGVLRTTQTVLENMQEIAASAGSFITYDISTGKWSTVISRVTAQTISFGDSNIIGNVAVSGTALESFYNLVEVQFPYGFLRDQSNFINIELPENLRNLNEQDNELQLNYELVNNVVQAHLLGNIELRQSREDISVTFRTDYSKYNVQIGDVFGLTNSVYGWTDKKFRVIRVKKNESDAGELTLEITGLSYNDDIYTVEPISDFTPNIGPGQSIPNLGAIATPQAPVATTVTFNSQPNILISGVIPQGVVTEMEFWYAKDPETTVYTLLGSTRNENGGVFEIGALTAFKTVLLNSGTYRFKVRAVNASGSSQFSPASDPVDYVYTQAPDVLPYNVPAVDANGNTLDNNGDALNLGLLAFYVASKLNWGGILSEGAEVLADLFGLDPSIVEDVQDLVASETPLVIRDEGTTLTSEVKSINFVGAGVTATQSSGNVTVTIPGSALTVRDESTTLSTTASNINFVGTGVTASGSGANITVTIPGSSTSLTIRDEGSTLTTTASNINFVGTGVTASGVGTDVTVTVPGCDCSDTPAAEDLLCNNSGSIQPGILNSLIAPIVPGPNVPGGNICSANVFLTDQSYNITYYPKLYLRTPFSASNVNEARAGGLRVVGFTLLAGNSTPSVSNIPADWSPFYSLTNPISNFTSTQIYINPYISGLSDQLAASRINLLFNYFLQNIGSFFTATANPNQWSTISVQCVLSWEYSQVPGGNTQYVRLYTINRGN
jgi:hypothetical protein